jgi:hypothetical protein
VDTGREKSYTVDAIQEGASLNPWVGGSITSSLRARAETGAAVAHEPVLTEVVVSVQKRTSGGQEVPFAVVVSTEDQNLNL